MKNQKTLALLGLILLFSFTVFYVLDAYFYVSHVGPSSDIENMRVSLEVKHFRNGQLLETIEEKDDLILNNFAWYLNALFHESDGIVQTTLVCPGNNEYVFTVWNDTITYTVADAFSDSSTWAYIVVGNYDGEATRPNYQTVQGIDQSYVGWTNGASAPTYSNGYVNFSANIPITQNYSLREVGYFISRMSSSEMENNDIMLFHDFITPISVNSGDWVIVTYRLYLGNTGFVDNFGNFLKYWLTGSVNGISQGMTPSDGAGTNSIFVFRTSYNNNWFGRSDNESCGGWVGFGTGTTALARTQYKLVTEVGRTQNWDSELSGNEYDLGLELYATMGFASNYNIAEAGFFVELYGSSTGYLGYWHPYMFWRQVFSPTYLPAGIPINVEFDITY